MLTDKPVLPLRPRRHVHASMLLEGSEDDHAVSTSSLRPPTNDSQTRILARAVSAKVRILSGIGIKYSTSLLESYAIAKVTARCALHMDALNNFGSLWLRLRLYIS